MTTHFRPARHAPNSSAHTTAQPAATADAKLPISTPSISKALMAPIVRNATDTALSTTLLAVTAGVCLFSSTTWLKVALLGLSLIVAAINLGIILIKRKEAKA